MFRVIVDADTCESNAFCIGFAPDVFELDDDSPPVHVVPPTVGRGAAGGGRGSGAELPEAGHPHRRRPRRRLVTEPIAVRTDVDYDPTSPEVLADPLPAYEAAARQCPVHLFEGLEHPLYTPVATRGRPRAAERRRAVVEPVRARDLLQRAEPRQPAAVRPTRAHAAAPLPPRAVPAQGGRGLRARGVRAGGVAHRRVRGTRSSRAARRLRVAAADHGVHPPPRPSPRRPAPVQVLGREAHAGHDLPRSGHRRLAGSSDLHPGQGPRAPRRDGRRRPRSRTTIRSAPSFPRGCCRTWPATGWRTGTSPPTTR